jgi:hypothetical membrane protein
MGGFQLLVTLRPYPSMLEKVTFTQGSRIGGLLLIIQTIYLIRVTIYPKALPHNISTSHYLQCKMYCLVLTCIKAIENIRLFNVAMIQES